MPETAKKLRKDGTENLPDTHPLNPVGHFRRWETARRNVETLENERNGLNPNNVSGIARVENSIKANRRKMLQSLSAALGVGAVEAVTGGAGTWWLIRKIFGGSDMPATETPGQATDAPGPATQEALKSPYRKHLDKRFAMMHDFLESQEIVLPEVETHLTDITNDPDEIDRILTANFTPTEQAFTTRIEKVPGIREKLFEGLPPLHEWHDQRITWASREKILLKYIGQYDNDLFDVFPGGKIKNKQDRKIKINFLNVMLLRFMNREAMKKGYCLLQDDSEGYLLRKIDRMSRMEITHNNITWDVPVVTVTNEDKVFGPKGSRVGGVYSAYTNCVSINTKPSSEEFAQYGATNKEIAPWIYERGQALLREKAEKGIDTVTSAKCAHEALHWADAIDTLDLEIVNAILNEVFPVKEVLSEDERSRIVIEGSEFMDTNIKPVMLAELEGVGMQFYHAAKNGNKEAALSWLITLLVKYFKVENYTLAHVVLAGLLFEGGLKKGEATNELAWSQGQKLVKEITLEELELLGAFMMVISINGRKRMRQIYNERHPRYAP